MDLIESMRIKARTLLNDSKGSHDWEHTLRVYKLAIHIGKIENADLKIVKLAALLHDIGRHHEDTAQGKICHAKKGAEMARKILEKSSLSKDNIDQITHCIRSHRFRDDNPPQTREARVLFDADKLDAIGAVGIGRAFQFAGEVGARLHDPDVDPESTKPYSPDDTAYREYLVKLRKIKERVFTAEGRRLAQERHDFMVEFFKRLNQEVAGNL
ncbi:MAG TPA: HD domain-containing protein [bacterium]|nr:HD domain-containing protein [bacterium]